MTDKHGLHDERTSKLYKIGSKEEPAESIDQHIIQTAHAKAPSRKHYFSWPSLATAAVLVLSLSLVLKVLNHAPLEESIMEPLPTDDSSSPAPMLEQETEGKTDSSDPTMKYKDSIRRDEIRQNQNVSPKKFQEKQRSVTPPTSVKEADAMGSAQLKPAPDSVDKTEAKKRIFLKREAIISPAREAPDFKIQQHALEAPKAVTGKVQTKPMEELYCSDIEIPKSDSVEIWTKQYKTAMEQGRITTAECLKQAYFTRFGKTIMEISR